jgi:anti-anti-sigma regulatory factor
MLMPHDWKQFEQPDRMSAQPGAPLMTFLKGNEGSHVRISLRTQTRTDSQVLQVLLTAARGWAARGLDFDVCGLPPRMQQDCKLLGLNAETTGWSGLK